jgi:hypothetical protein
MARCVSGVEAAGAEGGMYRSGGWWACVCVCVCVRREWIEANTVGVRGAVFQQEEEGGWDEGWAKKLAGTDGRTPRVRREAASALDGVTSEQPWSTSPSALDGAQACRTPEARLWRFGGGGSERVSGRV